MNKKYILAMSMIGATVVSGTMSASEAENRRLTAAGRVRYLEGQNEQLAREIRLLRSWVCQTKDGSFPQPLNRKAIRRTLEDQASTVQLPSGPNLPSQRPRLSLGTMKKQLKETHAHRRAIKKALTQHLIKLTNITPTISEEDRWSIVGQTGNGEVVVSQTELPSSNSPSCKSRSFLSVFLSKARRVLGI